MQLTFLLLCSAISIGRLFQFAPFQSERCLWALQFSIAASLFALFGILISRRLGLRAFCDARFRLLHILVGELALSLYVIARSALTELAALHLPITYFELSALLLLLYFWGATNRELLTKSSLKSLLLYVTLPVFVGALFVAFRDLPKEVMQSSDPDQHAFFARQILRFGVLPWNQKDWGELGFQYPGGFAVLNFLWAKLGLLDVRDVVSAEPFLQYFCALGLLLQFGALKYERGLELPVFTLTFTVVAAILFPYVFQNQYFHLEGTPRLSSSAFMALSLVAFVLTDTDQKSGSQSFMNWRGLLLFNTVFLSQINPAEAIISGVLFLGVFLEYLHQGVGDSERSLKLLLKTTLAMILSSFILLICDPYYFNLFFGEIWHASLSKQGFEGAKASYAPIESVLAAFDFGFLDPKFVLAGFTLCCAIYWFLSRAVLDQAQVKRTWQLIAALISITLILPLFFYWLPAGRELYLLEVYFNQSLQRTFLLGFVYIFSLCAVLIHFKKNKLSLLGTALCGFSLFLPPSFYKNLNFLPRYNYCGPYGCLSADDKIVIQKITELYKASDVEGRRDKILVSNGISKRGYEKWLLPYAGTRALPFYEMFPLAFYYFQGSREYSVHNYRKHACFKLDIPWLSERRIRYLFVPAERGWSCEHGLQNLSEKYALFASGKSRFLKLY